MLIVVASYTCKPGKRAELMEIMKDNIINTRKEPGNISYDHFASPWNENDMHVLERWESAEAFMPHSSTEHHKRFCELRRPLLEPDTYRITFYDAEENRELTELSRQFAKEHIN